MASGDPHEQHTSSAEELMALNAMRRDAKAFLAWRDEKSGLRMLALDPRAPNTTIGRAKQVTIDLRWDSNVSSVHAEVSPIGPEWVIADDGLSKNGTFVGGERVGSRRRLRDEDRIIIGSTILVFHAAGAERTGTVVGGEVVQRSHLSDNEFNVLRSLCAPLIFRESEEPPTNLTIARQVHLSEEGVRRCLTRLYKRFGVMEDPKRRRLAQRAIATGVVGRADYRG
jgi:hypothetical protein